MYIYVYVYSMLIYLHGISVIIVLGCRDTARYDQHIQNIRVPNWLWYIIGVHFGNNAVEKSIKKKCYIEN